MEAPNAISSRSDQQHAHAVNDCKVFGDSGTVFAHCDSVRDRACAFSRLIKVGAVDVKKTVDVFVQDRLVASYPVVLEKIAPTDDDFIDPIKRHMRRHYSREDIAAAKFVVRSVTE